MIISHIKEYHKGWFVGDFSPALYRNKEFEIGHHKHTKGEPTFPHFHKLTTEMNYILKGKLKVSGRILQEGDIWIYEPGETSDVTFLDDSELIVIRWPSIPTDKYEAHRS
jgi:quercetin dioxygenase-like cupin family protein